MSETTNSAPMTVRDSKQWPRPCALTEYSPSEPVRPRRAHIHTHASPSGALLTHKCAEAEHTATGAELKQLIAATWSPRRAKGQRASVFMSWKGLGRWHPPAARRMPMVRK